MKPILSHFLPSLAVEPSRSNSFVIAGIVTSTSIVIIGGLIGLWYGYGKEKWRTRRCHLFQRELEESAAENTTNFAAEVEVASTTAHVNFVCHRIYINVQFWQTGRFNSLHPLLLPALSCTLTTAPVIKQEQ